MNGLVVNASADVIALQGINLDRFNMIEGRTNFVVGGTIYFHKVQIRTFHETRAGITISPSSAGGIHIANTTINYGTEVEVDPFQEISARHRPTPKPDCAYSNESFWCIIGYLENHRETEMDGFVALLTTVKLSPAIYSPRLADMDFLGNGLHGYRPIAAVSVLKVAYSQSDGSNAQRSGMVRVISPSEKGALLSLTPKLGSTLDQFKRRIENLGGSGANIYLEPTVPTGPKSKN